MECQQNSNDELISIIKIQDLKIQNLTNHLKNLEQLFHKWQSDALLSKRTSEPIAREVDCLKQYSRRSCLVFSSVKLPKSKNWSRKYREDEGASHRWPPHWTDRSSIKRIALGRFHESQGKKISPFPYTLFLNLFFS